MHTKIGYVQVTQAAGVLVKSGPAGFYGFTCTASTAGTITVYDNTAASGTVLYQNNLTAGQSVDFGGVGFAADNGIYVSVGGTGTVNVLYT